MDKIMSNEWWGWQFAVPIFGNIYVGVATGKGKPFSYLFDGVE